ncbi:hypothetical protein DR73_2246 [Enterobacteriaceae bacterium ATCC 29904]|nr:hypothetical protein DR73_2246 [Enterobacteriaceae bacterium ATCC 29904]
MTLTKEWLLKTIAELEEERDAIPGAVNEDAAMALAAMKMALASLEAEDSFEPVAFINGAWTLAYYRPPKELGLKIGDKLYAAPPAPVSVPEEVASAIESLKQTLVDCNRYNYCFDAVKRVEDACRAAMLQGADGTLTNEGTITDNADLITDSAAMLQGAAGNSPAIPDGYALVPVEPTMAMLDEFDSIIDHGAEDSKDAWSRLLAAAPQQDGKP